MSKKVTSRKIIAKMHAGVEPLLDTAQAAVVINKAKRTMDNWRSLDIGPPFVKIGASVRYAPADLRQYIRDNTHQCSSAARQVKSCPGSSLVKLRSTKPLNP